MNPLLHSSEDDLIDHQINSPYKQTCFELFEYNLVNENISTNIATGELKVVARSFDYVLPILLSATRLALYTIEGRKNCRGLWRSNSSQI